jgi:hypothetical protein
MKLLKKNTNTKTINEAFKVGDAVKWNTIFFDGRVCDQLQLAGIVTKVNHKTVDVETDKGHVYRLDAFIKFATGEWVLA